MATNLHILETVIFIESTKIGTPNINETTVFGAGLVHSSKNEYFGNNKRYYVYSSHKLQNKWIISRILKVLVINQIVL